MRSPLQLVITTSLVCHLFLGASPVASQALPGAPLNPQSGQPAGNCRVLLTAPPNAAAKPPGAQPQAKPEFVVSAEQPVEITAAQCEQAGKTYALRGHVAIKFGDYVFRGDTVTYDNASGDAAAIGHAQLDGGPRDMHITASHGAYNLRSQTGKFYDVAGTTSARFRGANVPTLTSSSPITFTAQKLEQTGSQEYVLYHGTITSCELPRPKWRFHAAKIILRVSDSAKIYNSTFRLKGVPIFYLPKVSLPTERLGRQSGFLIPTAGYGSKGYTASEGYYWAIQRTMDATLGGQYLSRRGWSTTDAFRARPSQKSFLNVNYFQVLDRGILQPVLNPDGSPVLNNGQAVLARQDQGGEDVKLNGETTFAHDIRGVLSLEYLNRYVFRTAFAETFSQAVDSEVRSTAFLTKNVNGFSFNGFASRYQNFQSTQPGDVITILHTPGLEASSVEQRVLGSPVVVSYDAAAEGLHRSEPGFSMHGLAGRFDVDPDISLPLFLHGWTIRPETHLRNTAYTQQAVPNATGLRAEHDALNRRTIDSSLEVRPPALAKTFRRTLAGRKIKHVIEPRLIYRYTNGVENFNSIIHFDFRDILSNTNEAEYGLIQRLYLRRAKVNCRAAAAPAADSALKSARCAPAGGDEFLTWEVKQKYFLDPNFGGAVVNGRRNVLATTVDFTGIAFLTDPRRFTPIVSRLRVRTTSASSLEWQLDYDTKKGRINSSTVYATEHFGDFFVEASHAYLQVPGEIVVDPATNQVLPPCIPNRLHQPPCVPLVFNQTRALFGYGSPAKRGWSAAINGGFDSEFNLLQYAAAQSAYNWDCCGVSFEYRRFFLPSVARNENRYGFAFTLVNIGSFGNLKRRERLF